MAIGRPRLYPTPKVGDRYGCTRVVAVLPKGALWERLDLKLRVRCMCGLVFEAYEFNLRKRSLYCVHRERGRVRPREG